MPSRLWLVLAFIAAFGATRAHAGSEPPSAAAPPAHATLAQLTPG